jgi:hypothetical protein
VRLDDQSLAAGHVLNGAPVFACQSTRVNIALSAQRIAPNAGTDFGVRWRLDNSFATSRWECLVMGQEDERDWISTVIALPCRRLHLSVHLPDVFENPAPQVVVYRCPEYPLLPVGDHGDISVDEDVPWELDADLTELEKSNVRIVGQRCEVDIEYPVVGHRYTLRWRVDTPVTETSTQRRGLAQQIRTTLLELVSDADLGATAGTTPHEEGDVKIHVSELRDIANSMLTKVTRQLIVPLIGTRYALDEELGCALFIFDEQAKCFRLVAEGRNRTSGTPIVREIPLNAGVTGAAFKHREASLYICPSCKGDEEEGAYVYFPEKTTDSVRPDYAALLAIPLHLEDLSIPGLLQAAVIGDEPLKVAPAPEEFLGVFTVTTSARDNRLFSLTGGAGLASLRKSELFTDIWTIAVQYFQGMADACEHAAAIEPGGEQAHNPP